MDPDEIVSDVISIIRQTTKSNYTISAQLSSKLFTYFSRIQLEENQWNELNQAVERFNQSSDHPDLHTCRQLIETISTCSNDSEERNYTLGRDRTVLYDSIMQLRDILKAHVDLNNTALVKLVQDNITQSNLNDLMNLSGMNVGSQCHGALCDIVRFLCQIDPNFMRSNVIDHPIVSNCTQTIQTNANPSESTGDSGKSTVISALNLLTKLVSTGETFPVQTNNHLTSTTFLLCVIQLVEVHPDDDDIVFISVKFLLSLNLRYDYPNENPIILSLRNTSEPVAYRRLIDNLILLFNRSIDPIENKTASSVVKFFADLFDDQNERNDTIFYESDERLIIEIISRELSDRSPSDETTTQYISLLEIILRKKKVNRETCTRYDELKSCLRSHYSSEYCLDTNRSIINEIFRKHKRLGKT